MDKVTMSSTNIETTDAVPGENNRAETRDFFMLVQLYVSYNL